MLTYFDLVDSLKKLIKLDSDFQCRFSSKEIAILREGKNFYVNMDILHIYQKLAKDGFFTIGEIDKEYTFYIIKGVLTGNVTTYSRGKEIGTLGLDL